MKNKNSGCLAISGKDKCSLKLIEEENLGL